MPIQILGHSLDATLVTAHSDKQQAAGNYRGGFGFHPLLATCGREVLGAILRPGNAGANTASDHIDVLELALEALPASVLGGEILARADGAGASHAFAAACRETKVRFSLGYAIHETIRDALLGLNESAWTAAINQDGKARKGAWVAELSAKVDLLTWPAGTRLICRRERPHPGAQLSFTDVDGHRFNASSPTRPQATSPPWRSAIVSTLASKTASASSRTAVYPSCRSVTLTPTRRGLSSR